MHVLGVITEHNDVDVQLNLLLELPQSALDRCLPRLQSASRQSPLAAAALDIVPTLRQKEGLRAVLIDMADEDSGGSVQSPATLAVREEHEAVPAAAPGNWDIDRLVLLGRLGGKLLMPIHILSL